MTNVDECNIIPLSPETIGLAARTVVRTAVGIGRFSGRRYRETDDGEREREGNEGCKSEGEEG